MIGQKLMDEIALYIVWFLVFVFVGYCLGRAEQRFKQYMNRKKQSDKTDDEKWPGYPDLPEPPHDWKG